MDVGIEGKYLGIVGIVKNTHKIQNMENEIFLSYK